MNIKAEIFDALAHPLRLKILEKLKPGPCCVCKIIPYVGAEQSNVSHHLAILRNAGLVRSEKRGLEVWYEVNDSRIYEVIEMVSRCIIKILQENSGILEVLAKGKEKI